ncbi:Transcriptional regulator (fragment) [Alteromonas alvinellae]
MKQQFYLGQWQVDVTSNTLSLGKLKRNLEPKTMDVLLLLCQHQGQVVSSEEIVAQCWPKSMVGDNPVHKAITNLRRALGDKASSPEYIETIRKRGYRIVADVQFLGDERAKSTNSKWKSASPYVGLSAFSANESQVYFGRDTLIRELVSRTAELFNRNRPFMMVLGSSGSGKSSLVHAGFLPKLLDKQGINGLYAHNFLSIDLADINTNASPFAIVDEIAAHMLDWGSDELGIFEGYSASLLADKLLTSPQSVVDIVKRFCEEHELQTISAYSFYAVIIDRLEVFLADTKIEDKDNGLYSHFWKR